MRADTGGTESIMNERIQNLKQYIVVEKRHHALRRSGYSLGLNELAEDFRSAGMSAQERAGKTIVATLNAEIPVILPNEKIVFTRTLKDIPEYFTQAEWDEIKASHFICEKGEVFNLSADYERILNEGLDARKATATKLLDGATDEEKILDVIAFPLNGNAQDLMMGAPGEVTEQQLREVHIKVRD